MGTGNKVTIPAAQLVDTNAQVHCVVSNTQSSVTSNPATLTVTSNVPSGNATLGLNILKKRGDCVSPWPNNGQRITLRSSQGREVWSVASLECWDGTNAPPGIYYYNDGVVIKKF